MENFLTSSSNRYLLFSTLAGLILIGAGIIYFKGMGFSQTKVEVLEDVKISSDSGKLLTAEIAGEVIAPGVYRLPSDSRVDDLLVKSGGFAAGADRTWVEKYLNRAARLTDGQKVYIPKVGEQTMGASANNSGGYQNVSGSFSSDSNVLININSASLKELDSLPGIGPSFGQKIIDHRPYSITQELVSKGAIRQSLYEKIKDKITLY